MTILWTRCNNCQKILYKQDILDNQNVCPSCRFHFRISSLERLGLLYDEGRYERFDEGILPVDALHFVDSREYCERLEENQRKTQLPEAVVSTKGQIGGIDVIVCAMDFSFMGGSMGSVVGEKITRAIERATAEKLPMIVISCSGGARMQEGALSLMQMAKISSVIAKMKEQAVPYLSILTDPTTGGVTASYAMLGDLNIAEPRALIGFAGPRVIEQTIRQTLPEGFQRSEFLLEKGMLDMIVERVHMRPTLIRCLHFLATRPNPGDRSPDASGRAVHVPSTTFRS
jgi:acetyl-CoA carboxylase carboxyl transferase subunit beta